MDKFEKEILKRQEHFVEQRVAREILSKIEEVCFSRGFFDYRVNYGSNGQRDYILNWIKSRYEVQ